MVEQENDKIPPPPGIVASLTAGFDAVATHITTIILPVLFDMILWIGPRVRIEVFLDSLITEWNNLAKENAIPAQTIQQAGTFWNLLAERANLTSLARTFPIGISSLMASQFSADTPFGKATSIETGSILSMFGWIILFTLVGWILGGLFYYQVARVALKRGNPAQIISLPHAMFQSVVLSGLWLALAMIASLPVVLLLMVLAFISTAVAQFFSLVLGVLVIWLLLPVYFSAHGIFTYGQNAFNSIMQSLRLVRFTMPSLSLFAIGMVIISQGLAYLWRIPSSNTWFMLIGIVGHAFISTSLLAASFIHYRDLNAWLQVVLERLHIQTTSARA
jgi:hypothetical protein